ncbi:bifunctional demethylmenaquinone methyltransferase/2-methoxy-6-polyprenyl-1,4-benzoquinol methylase UbiE [Bacteroides propionicifaciens]|uniref:bifunctional demethylmenaquinone methyltransferase/2-methoxy-6-polyprenyl-1,4-benzoquinol methylase UbiE n=1 Tax=Bacteroides propionicifaciens TaxID=392838 RepID=UPI0003791CC2|nr:bifunctional demethylmenaquinone methyltransferase/2-methoxy-6-polyprenyl-1,4-benzoquinol methylase UbiE [Bacteroides propionicifaciens]
MKYDQESIKPYNQEGKKTEQVEQMFDNIAPAYDKLNHILSFNIDKIWRNKAIKWLKQFKPKTIMDVATGTGDFALLAYKKIKPELLTGIDISEGMMNVGRAKVKKAGFEEHIRFEKEDCLNLTYSDNQYDAITVAFGIRNFESLEQGLGEMLRVLKPGGHLVILELTTPVKAPMKQLFQFYSQKVMPSIGKMISSDKNAYTYLPSTIKAFPQGEVMQEIIKKVGYREVQFKRLTFGTCTLYTATK